MDKQLPFPPTEASKELVKALDSLPYLGVHRRDISKFVRSFIDKNMKRIAKIEPLNDDFFKQLLLKHVKSTLPKHRERLISMIEDEELAIYILELSFNIIKTRFKLKIKYNKRVS